MEVGSKRRGRTVDNLSTTASQPSNASWRLWLFEVATTREVQTLGTTRTPHFNPNGTNRPKVLSLDI